MSFSVVAVAAALLLLGAIASGCGSDQSSSGVGAACTRTSDCASGLSCGVSGVCTAPDSGAAEGGVGGGDGGDAGEAGAFDARSAD